MVLLVSSNGWYRSSEKKSGIVAARHRPWTLVSEDDEVHNICVKCYFPLHQVRCTAVDNRPRWMSMQRYRPAVPPPLSCVWWAKTCELCWFWEADVESSVFYWCCYRDVNAVIYRRYKMKRFIMAFSLRCDRVASLSRGRLQKLCYSPSGLRYVSGTWGVKWPVEDTVHGTSVQYGSVEQPNTVVEAALHLWPENTCGRAGVMHCALRWAAVWRCNLWRA